MNPVHHKFRTLPDVYAVCCLPSDSPQPIWPKGEFISVTRTSDELSVICLASSVPPDLKAERGWRVLKLLGPFPLSDVGILASFTAPLARARVSVLAVGTFETDYLLVKEDSLSAAVAALEAAGHVCVA